MKCNICGNTIFCDQHKHQEDICENSTHSVQDVLSKKNETLSNVKIPLDNDLSALSATEQIDKLLADNTILYAELLKVQEQLEAYYNTLQDLQSQNGNTIFGRSSSKLHKENEELRLIIDTYKSIRKAENYNSLPYRMGNSLLKLGHSFITAPFKLLPTLLFFIKSTPPASLGGKKYTLVLDAYTKGNREAVERMLKSANVNSVIQADAYTTLAKHIQKSSKEDCAYFAECAYKTDPRDYRLKWWILRLIDNQEYSKAKALLELLPSQTRMTESEKNKFDFLKQEYI